jgi:hypothetical protein
VRRHPQGEVVAVLTVPGTSEGAIRCEARLGSTVQMAEFLDYRPGATVEVAATVDEPLPKGRGAPDDVRLPRHVGTTQVPGAASPQPALPIVWTCLKLNCSHIYMQGQPATLIDVRGPRRTNVTTSPATPEVAHAALEIVRGQEATWSGKLDRVRCRKGETHLVVRIPRSISGLSHFEAYTDDRAFVEELADYLDSADLLSDAEMVSVAGTICTADASRIKQYPDAPLLRIKQVESAKRPEARAVVGKRRAAASFRSNSLHTGLAALLRDPPSPGTEVKFAGCYQHFSSYNKTVRVTPENRLGFGISGEVVFAKVDGAAFADYRRGHIVEAVGVLSEEPDGFSNNRRCQN